MRVTGLLLLAIALPLLNSCGGNTQVAEGGIGGTGVSLGKVSGYGSIFVNGVEFDTDTAEFVIEEDAESSYTQDDIKLGMVVQVTGDHDGVTGTATKVDFSDQLEGIITAPHQLDADGIGTLETMQQIVLVDQTTVFDDGTNQSLLITDLSENDIVEVSGFSDGSGTIYATRIELKAQNWLAGEPLEVKGVVSNLTSTTFDIGSLTIDFSQNPDLPDGAPQEGWYVEVKGNSFTSSGEFLADEVELEGDGDLQVADNDEEVELEGVVTAPLSGDIFSLNGQPVDTANTTVDETAIIEGRELKVEGKMVDGIIEATEIEFEAVESELQEIASSVEAVDAVDINIGTITLMGQSIAVNNSTIMEDDLGDDQTFNLAEVLPGQYVNVDIYHDGNGWVAVKLERDSVPEPLVHEIEGLVQEIDVNGDPDLIRVLDVLINISLTSITPVEGHRVEISGDYDISTLTLTATSGEID